MKQAKSNIAARIIAVPDEAELAVRKAQYTTGFAAADVLRIRDASLAPFTLDRPTNIRAALDGQIRVTVHIDPRWTESDSYAVLGLTDVCVSARCEPDEIRFSS